MSRIARTHQMGLTLIELLLAIGLLSLLLVTTLAWTQTTTRIVAGVSKPLRFERCAGALRRAIAEDLRTGDFQRAASESEPAEDAPPPLSQRVSVSNSHFTILTRDRETGLGAVEREYRHRRDTAEILRIDRLPDDGPEVRRVVVLGDVARLRADLDDGGDVLIVVVHSLVGGRYEWSYRP